MKEARNNINTNGIGTVVATGKPNYDKRKIGAKSIFSLMCSLGKYEEAKSQVIDKNELNIINRMFDNAYKIVDNTFAKDEEEQLGMQL